MRGEVWDIDLPRAGPHPGIVLTVNALVGRISEVTVAMITGSAGPRSTRIPIGPDAGVTLYAESYVDATSVRTVPLAILTGRRGRIAPQEMSAVEQALRLVLGL